MKMKEFGPRGGCIPGAPFRSVNALMAHFGALADPRLVPPPPALISFILMQFSAKILQIINLGFHQLLGDWRPRHVGNPWGATHRGTN